MLAHGSFILILTINIFGGLIIGTGLGLVPVFIQIQRAEGNCTAYDAVRATSIPPHCARQDTVTPHKIVFPHTISDNVTCTDAGSNAHLCTAAPYSHFCYFDRETKTCLGRYGWTPLQVGVFAGATLVGGILGSASSSLVLKHVSRLVALMIISVTTVLSSLICAAAQVAAAYWAILVGRLLVGIGIGMVHVICPMCVNEAIPHQRKRVGSAVFQISLIGGLLFMGVVVGLSMEPHYPLTSYKRENAKTIVLMIIPTVFGAMLALAATRVYGSQRRGGDGEATGGGGGGASVVAVENTSEQLPLLDASINDSDKSPRTPDVQRDSVENQRVVTGDDADGSSTNSIDNTNTDDDDLMSPLAQQYAHDFEAADQGATDLPSSPTKQEEAKREREKKKFAVLTRCFVTATVLAMAQHLTGINAVMTYAPTITKGMGLPPLQSNAVVMSWNFCMSLTSLPLAGRFKTRKMYLGGLFVVAVSLFTLAFASYPYSGIGEGAKAPVGLKVLQGLSLAAYIAFFGIGMAPMFWVLTMELFPESHRALGSSYVNTMQQLMATILVVAYPPLKTSLSGGKSGDQEEGMAYVIGIFGCVAVLTFIFLFKFLHPSV